MYASAAMLTTTESVKIQNGVFAMSSTRSQMRKTTLIQNAPGFTAVSPGARRAGRGGHQRALDRGRHRHALAPRRSREDAAPEDPRGASRAPRRPLAPR